MSPSPRAGDGGSVRSDATRERILRAAATTLSRRGYAESRLSDIAELAGLRPPAVYYYFGSRDALIAEVLRVGQQRVRSHVERRLATLDAAASAIDRVCAAAEAHLEVQLELSDFANAVTRNAAHVTGDLHAELQRESDAYHALWKGLLARAVGEGELRTDLDPAVARMLVIGALNWSTEWWSPERPVADLIGQASAMIRTGLEPPTLA